MSTRTTTTLKKKASVAIDKERAADATKMDIVVAKATKIHKDNSTMNKASVELSKEANLELNRQRTISTSTRSSTFTKETFGDLNKEELPTRGKAASAVKSMSKINDDRQLKVAIPGKPTDIEDESVVIAETKKCKVRQSQREDGQNKETVAPTQSGVDSAQRRKQGGLTQKSKIVCTATFSEIRAFGELYKDELLVLAESVSAVIKKSTIANNVRRLRKAIQRKVPNIDEGTMFKIEENKGRIVSVEQSEQSGTKATQRKAIDVDSGSSFKAAKQRGKPVSSQSGTQSGIQSGAIQSDRPSEQRHGTISFNVAQSHESELRQSGQRQSDKTVSPKHSGEQRNHIVSEQAEDEDYTETKKHDEREQLSSQTKRKSVSGNGNSARRNFRQTETVPPSGTCSAALSLNGIASGNRIPPSGNQAPISVIPPSRNSSTTKTLDKECKSHQEFKKWCLSNGLEDEDIEKLILCRITSVDRLKILQEEDLLEFHLGVYVTRLLWRAIVKLNAEDNQKMRQELLDELRALKLTTLDTQGLTQMVERWILIVRSLESLGHRVEKDKVILRALLVNLPYSVREKVYFRCETYDKWTVTWLHTKLVRILQEGGMSKIWAPDTYPYQKDENSEKTKSPTTEIYIEENPAAEKHSGKVYSGAIHSGKACSTQICRGKVCRGKIHCGKTHGGNIYSRKVYGGRLSE